MSEAICIAGLPGSGKTHLGIQLAQELGAVLVDDIKDLSQLPDVGEAETVIVTDPNFCLAHVRSLAESHLLRRYDEVRWIFFANDPQRCRALVRRRDDGRRVDNLISQLSERYEIPPNADVRPIWQPE